MKVRRHVHVETRNFASLIELEIKIPISIPVFNSSSGYYADTIDYWVERSAVIYRFYFLAQFAA